MVGEGPLGKGSHCLQDVAEPRQALEEQLGLAGDTNASWPSCVTCGPAGDLEDGKESWGGTCDLGVQMFLWKGMRLSPGAPCSRTGVSLGVT